MRVRISISAIVVTVFSRRANQSENRVSDFEDPPAFVERHPRVKKKLVDRVSLQHVRRRDTATHCSASCLDFRSRVMGKLRGSDKFVG